MYFMLVLILLNHIYTILKLTIRVIFLAMTCSSLVCKLFKYQHFYQPFRKFNIWCGFFFLANVMMIQLIHVIFVPYLWQYLWVLHVYFDLLLILFPFQNANLRSSDKHLWLSLKLLRHIHGTKSMFLYFKEL